MRVAVWWLVVVGVAAVCSPRVAGAQAGLGVPGNRQRRADTSKPAATAKLDDAVKKFASTERAERLEGIDQLAQLGTEAKAVQLLLEGVSDPDAAVSIKSIDALGGVRNPEATTVLTQRLLLRDQPLPVKQHILASLGRIGDPRATSSIVDLLSRATEAPVRGSAIFALGEIGDRSALPALERVAADATDPTLQRLAGEAAQKVRDRPAPDFQLPSLAGDPRGRPGGPPGR